MKNKVVKYMEVKNVPTRLLNRFLLEGGDIDLIRHAIMKDNESPKLRSLKLKYKVNPKEKMPSDQLFQIALEYMEDEKPSRLYSALMIANKNFIERSWKEVFEKDFTLGDTITEDIIIEMVDNFEVYDIVSYMRYKEEMHKYIPALIKSWSESEEFNKQDIIKDLYGFEYDKTLKEEFDISVTFDDEEKLSSDITAPFEAILEKTNIPMEAGLELIIQELEVLKKFSRESDQGKAELLKEYESKLEEKEKELTKLKKDFNRMEKQVKKAKETNDANLEELEVRNNKIDSLTALLEEKNAKIEEMKKAKKEASKSYNATIRSLEKDKQEAELHIEKIKELESIIAEKDARIEQSEGQIECLKEAYERIEDAHTKLIEENIILEKAKNREQIYKERIKYLEMMLEQKEESAKRDAALTSEEDVYEDMGYDLGDDLLGSLLNNPTF